MKNPKICAKTTPWGTVNMSEWKQNPKLTRTFNGKYEYEEIEIEMKYKYI